MSIRNIKDARKDSYKDLLYHTFLESYSNREQILMHEGNYQQLYYTFLDFCGSQD